MFRFPLQRLLAPGYFPVRYTSTENGKVDVYRCAEVACRLVGKAAELLREAGEKIREFETKENSADLVTETDREIEKLLIGGLRQVFPDHVFIGEEGTAGAATGRLLTDEPTWFIDPIDGTSNFVHGFPYFYISVGFWLNKQPELAICYNPKLNLRLTARRNCGAFLNGAPMRVSGQVALQDSLIMHELNPANFEPSLYKILIANVKEMLQKAQTLRTSGSAVSNLCLVAMGAADGYFEFYPHCWDMAAGVLLVREAGGIVMDPAGGELDIMSRRLLAAATPKLGSQMAHVLGDKQIYHKRDDELTK